MEKKLLTEDIIADLERNYRGKGDDVALDEAIASLKKCQSKYHATGTVLFALFYNRVTVDYENKKFNKKFTGNGGGVGSVGGGALVGDIYTDDLDKVFEKTERYQVTSTTGYAYVLFLDKNSKVLGSFQTASISLGGGVFGGTGDWS